MRRMWFGLLFALGTSFQTPVDAPSVHERALAEWRAAIAPSDAEREWTTIGWRPSFWQAVLEANRTDKPVLLWAMNGHPLGCT